MATVKLLIVLICCVSFLSLSFYFDENRHRHDYKKVLYYIDEVDEIELYSELRCSCGKIKNHKYVTTKYCSTVLGRADTMKRIKTLGYIPKEELEADLIAPLDWIEDNREALEEYVYSNVQIALSRIQADNPMHSWLNGKGIGIIVDCVRNGYEVEKEKLYTVKFSNEDFSKNYIGIFKAVNKLGISSLPFNDDDVKSWFTEDELKKFKFWANPAFEIEEVEE